MWLAHINKYYIYITTMWNNFISLQIKFYAVWCDVCYNLWRLAKSFNTRDIMLVKHLRKGVKAAQYTLNIIIISVRGATCCIWARVAAPGAEEITAIAGHWPLDWYYRCNIVNNVPLSAFSARERPRLCPRGVHGMVTSLPDRPTGARQHPLPGPSTSVTSVYCWIFILQSRALAAARERRTRSVHILFELIPGLTIHLP